MEVLVDKYGRRVFINQPKPDGADQKWNLVLYDPNGPSRVEGLYDRSMMACGRWEDYFRQFQKMHPTTPAYSIDWYGRTTPNPANYRHNPYYKSSYLWTDL